jgi:hypothetical protein
MAGYGSGRGGGSRGRGGSGAGRVIPGRRGQVTGGGNSNARVAALAGGRARRPIQAVNTVSQSRRTGETGANTFSSRFGGVMTGPRLVS